MIGESRAIPVTTRRVLGLIVMTVAEAGAGYYWLTQVAAAHGEGGVYAFPVVLAGMVLAAGLFIEDATVTVLNDPSAWNPFRGMALSITETIVWSQWANVVLLGLWSATGVGPAAVVLAALLTLQHGVETNLTFGERPQLRHAVNAGVEAVTLTTAWTLLVTNSYPLLAAGVMVAGFSIEHAYRLTETGTIPVPGRDLVAGGGV